MELILFSKMLANRSIDELADFALELGIDGYDLCVRPGHPVNPDNVLEALPRAVGVLQQRNVSIPMVTAHGGLLDPDSEEAGQLLSAMSEAGVALLKLGYFHFTPLKGEYEPLLQQAREHLMGWERLGREHGVRVCYHTHSGSCVGQNAGGLRLLLEGRDPRWIGAYLDAGHLCAEGERFAAAIDIVGPYLAMVSAKDVLLTREEMDGHGRKTINWVEAGQGMVNWTEVFNVLRKQSFNGPISIHCEFPIPEGETTAASTRETSFFKQMRAKRE